MKNIPAGYVHVHLQVLVMCYDVYHDTQHKSCDGAGEEREEGSCACEVLIILEEREKKEIGEGTGRHRRGEAGGGKH
jgi:hypothetical protein